MNKQESAGNNSSFHTVLKELRDEKNIYPHQTRSARVKNQIMITYCISLTVKHSR